MSREVVRRLTRLVSLTLLLVLGGILLAACASSPAASPGGQSTPTQPGPTAAAAKQSPTAAPAAAGASPTAAPQAAKTSATAAPDASEKCPLLTKQEVEATLGKAVLSADVMQQGQSLTSCGFRNPQSVSSLLVGVLVKSGSQAQLGFETSKKLADDARPVAGLGDDAFWSESEGNLEILKGDTDLRVSIYKDAAADRAKVAQDLGKKALGRLASAPAADSTPSAARTATTSGAALDGCSLLTKQEVEAVIGKTVEPEKMTTSSAEYFGCSYLDPAHKPQYFVGLTILASTPTQAKGAYDSLKYGATSPKAIAGLGDEAYWNGERNTLEVLKGTYFISLDLTSDATTDTLKAAQALAPKLLARLP